MTSPVFQIAPATKEQLPELAALLGCLFGQEREFEADNARQLAGLEHIQAHPETGCILAATHDCRVVGMVVVLFSVSTALGGPVATLEDLIVQPQARGRGVGSALVEAVVETAAARGCLRLTLLTDGDNRRAQALYARFGFRASSMLPMRLLMPVGSKD